MIPDSERLVLEEMKKAGPCKPSHIARSTGLETREVIDVLQRLKSKGELIYCDRCSFELIVDQEEEEH